MDEKPKFYKDKEIINLDVTNKKLGELSKKLDELIKAMDNLLLYIKTLPGG